MPRSLLPALVLCALLPTGGCCSFARFFCGPDKTPWVSVDFDAPGMMLYTSGTSGNPKGVPLSPRNVGTNTQDWLRNNAPWTLNDLRGVEVRDRVLGVVGYGRIGRRVAEICALGLRMPSILISLLGPLLYSLILSVSGRYDIGFLLFAAVPFAAAWSIRSIRRRARPNPPAARPDQARLPA